MGFPKIFLIDRFWRIRSSPASENISPASDITFGSLESASSEYPPSNLRFEFHRRAMCMVSAAKPRSVTPWFSMTCLSKE